MGGRGRGLKTRAHQSRCDQLSSESLSELGSKAIYPNLNGFSTKFAMSEVSRPDKDEPSIETHDVSLSA